MSKDLNERKESLSRSDESDLPVKLEQWKKGNAADFG
jgi:hypothetical protein